MKIPAEKLDIMQIVLCNKWWRRTFKDVFRRRTKFLLNCFSHFREQKFTKKVPGLEKHNLREYDKY